jgi:hypothetical protein
MKDSKKRLIHFGQLPYGQFKDKIGVYKHLDNNDETRKKLYYKRFGTTTDKNTALYWASKILW